MPLDSGFRSHHDCHRECDDCRHDGLHSHRLCGRSLLQGRECSVLGQQVCARCARSSAANQSGPHLRWSFQNDALSRGCGPARAFCHQRTAGARYDELDRKTKRHQRGRHRRRLGSPGYDYRDHRNRFHGSCFGAGSVPRSTARTTTSFLVFTPAESISQWPTERVVFSPMMSIQKYLSQQ